MTNWRFRQQSPAVASTCAGESRAWLGVLRQVVEVARFTDASVLVTGESGTGKELVARLMHQLDPRRCEGDLVVVDCTTVVQTLSGSEFFGHVKGAFTGASAERIGAFALADGGTLFLDEVGELPGALQAELLRVVQEKTYKPVGSNAWKKTDFGSCARPTATCGRKKRQDDFAATCTIVWRAGRATCRRCANGRRTFFLSPGVSFSRIAEIWRHLS